jgi:hypothetical protein
MAVAYEQVAAVHRQGYLETASGTGLEMVVALVGIERRRGGFTEGTVVFSRSQAAEGDVVIPQGTRVAGPPKGQDPKRPVPPVETLEEVTLKAGDLSIPVRVRSVGAALNDMVVTHSNSWVQVLCLAKKHDCHSFLRVLKAKHLATSSDFCHSLYF